MKSISILLLSLLFILGSSIAEEGIYWKDVDLPQDLTLHFTPDKALAYGEIVIPNEAENAPEVKWEANPNSYYTIAIINPDIVLRNRPDTKQFIHWLVVNILGSDLSSGNVLVPFMGPHPFKNTGTHRYTVFLFEQKEKQDFEAMGDQFAERTQFNIRNFAENNNLDRPISATYFQSNWEPYVDDVLKKHLKRK